MRRVGEGLKDAGASAAFLTLTSLPNTSVTDMMAAWNRFKTALRRVAGGFEYAAIKEFGSTTGMLHLHVVLTGWSFIPQHTLSAMWRKASRGAFVVDIRSIPDPERTARYVAKYVSKTIARIDVRKAVTYSRGWPKLAEREARWHATGEEWDSPTAPPKRWDAVLAGGALVSVDRGCECVSETGHPYAAADVLRDLERQRLSSHPRVRVAVPQ